MQTETEAVEIQEPPIEELKKGRSCLRYSCLSGCGCVLIPLICVLFLLNLVLHSGTRTLKELPDWFPAEVDLYNQEEIETISQRKQRTHALLPFDVFSKKEERSKQLVVTWKELLAQPEFISQHYQRAYSQAGFSLHSRTRSGTTERFHFQHPEAGIAGFVEITDDPNTKLTDKVSIETYYNPEYGD